MVVAIVLQLAAALTAPRCHHFNATVSIGALTPALSRRPAHFSPRPPSRHMLAGSRRLRLHLRQGEGSSSNGTLTRVTSYSQVHGRIHVQENTSYTISIGEDVSTKHAIILAPTLLHRQ